MAYSCVICSDQFAWANGRFDDIFSLKSETCAGAFLQPFFGIVGTAVTVLGASSLLRLLVNFIMKRVSPKEEEDNEASSTGLGFGAFEYAVIRAAHLGLCQAGGYAIAVAMYTPTCGVDSRLVWALAMCWLLSFPVGFTLYMAFKLNRSRADKEIKFSRKKHAGSWGAYFSKIHRAESSHGNFCRPHVIHYILKIFLALAGALLIFLAISFVSDPSNSVLQTVLLFVFGFISLILAMTISRRPGRKLVVYLTNIFAAHLGKKFVMVEGDAVMEENIVASSEGVFSLVCYPFISAFVLVGAWIQAKVDVMLDPLNIWNLSHRGKWIKKDELKVFYSELNDRGIYFSIFLMIKNVIIGITLADSPSLVGALQKVISF